MLYVEEYEVGIFGDHGYALVKWDKDLVESDPFTVLKEVANAIDAYHCGGANRITDNLIERLREGNVSDLTLKQMGFNADRITDLVFNQDYVFLNLLVRNGVTQDMLSKDITKRALRDGYGALADTLIENDIHLSDFCLSLAIEHKNLDAAIALLNKGFNVNPVSLRHARMDSEFLKALLEAGANFGTLAVHQAVLNKDPVLAETLLETGHETSISTMEEAVKSGDEFMVHLLLKHGVEPTPGAVEMTEHLLALD